MVLDVNGTGLCVFKNILMKLRRKVESFLSGYNSSDISFYSCKELKQSRLTKPNKKFVLSTMEKDRIE